MLVIVDDFCPDADAVRDSVLKAGFNNWNPDDGHSAFQNLGFWGEHAPMMQSLAHHLGAPVYPSQMYFRVTKRDSPRGCVHTDKTSGNFTCVVYLSSHEAEGSGTAFYRHKSTGCQYLPMLDDGLENSMSATLVKDLRARNDEDWEQLDFVRGLYNRAIIFPGARFHARKFKAQPNSSDRIVWSCHFKVGEGSPWLREFSQPLVWHG